jgi:hypothetical protein
MQTGIILNDMKGENIMLNITTNRDINDIDSTIQNIVD